MKKGIILLAFICISITGSAQAGYLGDLNAVELKIGLSPSLLRKNKIVEVDDQNYVFSSLRYALPSYQLNIARTVSRKIELSAGFEFAAMSLIAERVVVGNSNTSYIMQENLKAIRIGANFEFRYYRKGSFSPIGKYIGFSINGGKAGVKTEDGLIYGTTGSSLVSDGSFGGSNFFTRKREVNWSDTTYTFSRTEATYTALRFVIGRNIPLGNGLTLNFGMSAPVLSYYNSGFGGVSGVRMLDFFGDDQERIVDGVLDKSLRYTMHKYNRISLSVSIKKYF